jgi:tetratricopeptide (TPR) repeat protein
MMRQEFKLFILRRFSGAAFCFLMVAAVGFGQNPAAAKPAPATAPIQPAPGKTADATPAPDHAVAYYHLALAGIYEEEAGAMGRSEDVSHAIEEFKLALNADPSSPQLNNGLADLYFRTGRIREAVATAQGLLKNSPNNLEAHKLLGRIYLRQLGNAPGSGASNGSSGASSASDGVLEQAIAEFEKIVALEPAPETKSVEDHMLLGQLYTVKHEAKKAEEQFRIAQSIEPDSEEVVLNLARVYAEGNDLEHAAKVIEAVAVNNRTARMEFTLGALYDQLKRGKDAITAYQRSLDMEPDDLDTQRALAQALLEDKQLDEALKQFKALAEEDPEDTASLIRVSEIERRQQKYEEALATIRQVRAKNAEDLEGGFNEGLLLDILGRYDEASTVLEKMVEQTSHANGAYTDEEKNNRGLFLERLAGVYHEQNKTDAALATYEKMIAMGGESAVSGYRGEVDVYHDARQYDKAVAVARKAVAASPKDQELALILADELVGVDKTDEGVALARGLLTNSADDRAVWLELAQIDTRTHRWKDAEDALAKADALTAKKDDRLIVYFLEGALAERQKHYEQAEQLFNQALEIDPANAGTLNYLGYMLADKGNRLPEALKMTRQAVEQEPMNGAYLDSLGWTYFKLGQYEPAEENLRQAVERDQTDPTVHDHLGDLYEKTGRIRLAAAQWELSLSLYAKTAAADIEPGEVAKVEHKLESARVKLAKQENTAGPPKPE